MRMDSIFIYVMTHTYILTKRQKFAMKEAFSSKLGRYPVRPRYRRSCEFLDVDLQHSICILHAHMLVHRLLHVACFTKHFEITWATIILDAIDVVHMEFALMRPAFLALVSSLGLYGPRDLHPIIRVSSGVVRVRRPQ